MQTTHRLAASAALAALALSSAAGCVVVHDDGPIIQDAPSYAVIDRGEILDTDLGYGAGVFVEYAEGGEWTIWTSCDSALSGTACYWDVYVSSQSAIDQVEPLDLELDDQVEQTSTYDLSFYANTALGSDAVRFRTGPGDLVSLDVLLDGYRSPDYLVWWENGQIVHGAPTSPAVFQPNAP